MSAKKVIWVAALATVASLSSADSGDRDVCALFQGEEDMVTHILYMHQEDVRHKLRIPTVYFEDPWDHVDGAEHDSQLFRVMMDDFTPVYRPYSATLKKTGRHDYMSFVIHDLVEFNQLTENSLSSSTVGKAKSRSDFAEWPAEFSLTALKPKTEIEQGRDAFIDKDSSGSVRTVLSCSPEGDVKNPGCSHDFRVHGIDVRLTYRRGFLPQWKRFEDDVDTFLNCALNF